MRGQRDGLTRTRRGTTVAQSRSGVVFSYRSAHPIMPDAAKNFRILHVRRCTGGPQSTLLGGGPAAGQPGDVASGGGTRSQVETWIAQSGIACEECDAYRGLARLMRDTRRVIRAVVVCADDLDRCEFDLFGLVGRYRPDVTLLAYGRTERSHDLRSALDCGALLCTQAALARLTPGPLRSADDATAPSRSWLGLPRLASGPSRSPEQAPLPPVASAPAPSTAKTPVAPEPDTDRIASRDNGPPEQKGGHEPALAEPLEGPARVPWVRYGDVPVRQKPTDAAAPVLPSSKETNGSEPPARPLDAYEPLLTDEELRALMSDDFEGLGVNERESLLDDESQVDADACRKTKET